MLPPVPDDVAFLSPTVDVNGLVFSFGLWIQCADFAGMTILQAETLLSSFDLSTSNAWLACMHNGCALSTCRLAVGGTSGLRYARPYGPNSGLFTGGQADAIAAGIYLMSSTPRRGSGTRVRIPGTPDVFVSDGYRLTLEGRDNLQVLCDQLANWVASVTGPAGSPVLIGTLSRRTTAGPLPAAAFTPTQGIIPSLRVERLSRRMPRRGYVSTP